ncbi:F-box kelch-repeat At3g23880-like [Olea europaea subsp. europaea]|uniref:F-box kelch-repeat At3g23880-like n=1 Tax=Olea europaea subsp. europaea TaxID=158383 RepID=A0A8S0SEN0_OLEEU|nr:F-box kelch-repeat At3g23880-like [Olea europaea subsp. europaea]
MAAKLPCDIIIEILSRLPVRSLIRFKCVSKSFHYLISKDPNFKKKHMNQSAKSVLYLESPGNRVLSNSLSSFSNDEERIQDLKILVTPVKGSEIWTIYDSCDGLFCIEERGRGVFVWNPSTKESKKLPDCPIDIKIVPGIHSRGFTYAIAYDSISDDYKVFSIFLFLDIGKGLRTKLKSYSLKSDSLWRKVENFPSVDLWNREKSNLLNGAFHWIAIHGKDNKEPPPFLLVSLEIGTETYRELSLPWISCCTQRFPQLCVLKGKLCLYNLFFSKSFDLWVIEEYGVMESLTKMFTIPFYEDQPQSTYFTPMYLFEDGKIMLKVITGGRVQVVTYKDGILASTNLGNSSYQKARIWTETLISPHLNN